MLNRMRDSCIFYRSFFEAMNGLDKETKANVYDAIFDYSLNGKEIELNGLEKTIFTLVKPQLDANNKRFENGNVLFVKEVKFNFKQELINLGADKNLVDEWILIRKTKKLTNTKTALESFVKEINKKGKTINEVLTKCVTDSWGGFKASWDWKEENTNIKNLSNGGTKQGIGNKGFQYSNDFKRKIIEGLQS